MPQIDKLTFNLIITNLFYAFLGMFIILHVSLLDSFYKSFKITKLYFIMTFDLSTL